MEKHRIYSLSVASVYPHYIAKAEKKGRTKAEVDQIICWLTGYGQQALDDQLAKNTDFRNFFAQAPRMNPSRSLITGVICGVRVEEIQDTTMREIRYLDKLIDELAKGKAMEKIAKVVSLVSRLWSTRSTSTSEVRSNHCSWYSKSARSARHWQTPSGRSPEGSCRSHSQSITCG
jgi:hypothetical protein